MTIFRNAAQPARQLSTEGLVPERRPPPIEERVRPSMRAYDMADSEPPAGSRPSSGEDQVTTAPANPDFAEVVLSKPYMAHGEPVQRFQLRRPVTREIKQCGNPLRPVLDDTGRIANIEVRWDVIALYVPLLSNPPLPPATVDQFEFFDLDACAAALSPFFIRLSP